MTICKTKKWGSSLGVVIPKAVVDELHLTENQEIEIEVHPAKNPFQEMFGAFKRKPGRSTRQIIKEARAELGAD